MTYFRILETQYGIILQYFIQCEYNNIVLYCCAKIRLSITKQKIENNVICQSVIYIPQLKMSITKIKLEYDHHQYKSIPYKSASIDSDYLGWKYENPIDYSKLVILNNFIDISEILGVPKNDKSRIELNLHDPCFHITTWDDLGDSPVFRNFFHVCLFFDDISPELITECVQHFIIDVCDYHMTGEKYGFGIEESITEFREMVKMISLQNTVDYDEVIVFDREINGIRSEKVNIKSRYYNSDTCTSSDDIDDSDDMTE